MTVPIPPISVNPSSSSQANSRTDALQGGVKTGDSTFGDLIIFGSADAPNDFGLESETKRLFINGGGNAPSSFLGIPLKDFILIVIIGGIALWLMITRKK